MTEDLAIDPRLWVGDDLDARLRHRFVDMRTTLRIAEFIAEKREKDPTAAFIGWRRIRHLRPRKRCEKVQPLAFAASSY